VKFVRIAGGAALFVLAACQSDEPLAAADLLLTNAYVYTADE
jgi:hypothetical protein